MSEPKRRVLIVTPTFNSEAFLDETIYSVVAQAGRGIDLHYHLQDGGSRDGTVEILKKWARRVAKSELPVLCNTLTLTFSSERDGGMYDALNRGFACLDPQPDDLLTWINSDDRLNLGAVSTVCAAMRDIPECQFVSGRISLINEEGAVTTVKGPGSYPRGTLAAGMHDGRREAFVMQEGTFFSGALWLAVGGVDVGYRLAGDWDLWRRMGQRAELYGIDTVTAVHRRRRGQLSGDMNKYYAEIDALPAEILAVVRPEQQTSNLIRWETYTSRWISLPFNAAASPPPDLISQGRVARGCHCKFHEGFLPPEGPYPEYHLPGGVRWMSRFEARIWITAIMSGRHRVRAKLRSTENGLIFVARINDQEAYRARLPDPLPMKDEVVEFSCWLRAGLNDFHLITESAEQSGRRLMIVELEVTEDAPFTAGASGSVAASETALDHHTAQRLAVVVHLRHRPDLLDATIASVRSEAGPRAHLTVVGESTGASADLLAVVSSWVDEVVEPMKARKNVLIERLPALRARGFNHVLELEAGDVLAPGGLSCAFDLMARSGALAVRGLEATRNSVGVLVRRGFSARAARASLRAVSSPSRFRRGAVADMARLFVVAAQTGYPAEKRVVLGPRMILLDRRNERTIAHSRLFNLAAALALLGLDVRHVRVEPTDDGREPAALQGCEVVTNGPGAELIDGPLMTLEAGKGGWSSLRPCNPAAAEAELRLPAAIDTAAFKPRSKWDSRIRFGLPPSASILLIDVGDWTMASGLAKDLARACADHGLVLLDAGEETFPSELAPYRCASGASLSDPVVASYQLNAVDFVIQHQGRWSDLILAAAACGLPALDAAGRLVGPDGELELIAPDLIGAVARLFADRDLRAQIALKSRAVVEAEWSLEALAAQLRREAAKLTVAPGLAEWVGGRHELEVGPVPVRSGSASRLDPSTLSDMLGFRFIPIEGAQGLLPEPSRVVAPSPCESPPTKSFLLSTSPASPPSGWICNLPATVRRLGVFGSTERKWMWGFRRQASWMCFSTPI